MVWIISKYGQAAICKIPRLVYFHRARGGAALENKPQTTTGMTSCSWFSATSHLISFTTVFGGFVLVSGLLMGSIRGVFLSCKGFHSIGSTYFERPSLSVNLHPSITLFTVAYKEVRSTAAY